MNTDTKNPIEAYIARFPADVQTKLIQLRDTIRKAAPMAEERISYSMPTFRGKHNLVHFAVHKNHIGFYPGPSGIAAFAEEFGDYKWSKGAVQFPLDQKLPLGLVRRITLYRVREDNKR